MKNNQAVKYKSKNHKFMLYPDDPTHVKALEILKAEYEICYILHDRDIVSKKDVEKDIDKYGETSRKVGDVKKSHWHVLLRTNNQTWNTAICKQIGIDLNYIRAVPDFSQFARYLVHKDDADKVQYDVSELQGNLTGKCKDCIAVEKEVDEKERWRMVGDYIRNYDGVISRDSFDEWLIENDCYEVVKKNSYYYLSWIKEHNETARKKKDKERANNSYRVVTSYGTFASYEECYGYFLKNDLQTIRIIEVVLAGIKMPVNSTMGITELEQAVHDELDSY